MSEHLPAPIPQPEIQPPEAVFSPSPVEVDRRWDGFDERGGFSLELIGKGAVTAGEVAVRGIAAYVGEIKKAWLERTEQSLEHRDRFYADIGSVALRRIDGDKTASTTLAPHRYLSEGGLWERVGAWKAARNVNKSQDNSSNIKLNDRVFGSTGNPNTSAPKARKPHDLSLGFLSGRIEQNPDGRYSVTELPAYRPEDRSGTNRAARNLRIDGVRRLVRGDVFGAQDSLQQAGSVTVRKDSTSQQEKLYEKGEKLRRKASMTKPGAKTQAKLHRTRAKILEQNARQARRYAAIHKAKR